MLKVISLLFVLVTLSNAVIRKSSFTSGHVIKGKEATGINLTKDKNGQTVIEWTEQFDSYNDLTVYISQIYEDTGRLQVIELANLCKEYPNDSFDQTIKLWMLKFFRHTKRCPIKTGKITLRYPLRNTYNATIAGKECGPILSTIQFVKTKKPDSNSDKAPLMISAQLRGAVTGC
ncbi:uncharacterized protein LOC127288374 [Leptopilina boulardi]|uniref:uncharacterized protein LOC127288374 n=1 Tax=Leptopilina boulardi TaxID=63433 RepID=UPI0021F5041B|nr:uncharacterized protein LOC127288374 [Leptopilina boulardi]